MLNTRDIAGSYVHHITCCFYKPFSSILYMTTLVLCQACNSKKAMNEDLTVPAYISHGEYCNGLPIYGKCTHLGIIMAL